MVQPGSADVDGSDAAVFVFADDLDVFGSVRDAETYYEPWFEDDEKAVYDQSGNVLRMTAFDRIEPAAPPVNRRDEFVERLRYYLDGVAEQRPDLLQREWGGARPRRGLDQVVP
jgi:hypothetical protein